jgi:hypothetical protein
LMKDSFPETINTKLWNSRDFLDLMKTKNIVTNSLK